MTEKERTFAVVTFVMVGLLLCSWALYALTSCASSNIDCRAWANKDLKECRDEIINGDGE